MPINYKNAHYSEAVADVIDCDFEHPVHGWIPTTISVSSPDKNQVALLARILSENTQEDLKKVVRNGVLKELTVSEFEAEQQEQLIRLKPVKLAELDVAARETITAGFNSSALGDAHEYGGKQTDQINLIGAVSSAVDMPFPCCDSDGIWGRKTHTHAQLKEVVRDGAVFKQSILERLDQLRSDVSAAATLEELAAIGWV